MDDLEYLTCTDQEDTAERDVVRSLFGYEDEEDFLEDIEGSSLERLEELANILEELEDGARYYRQKCLLELKEYSDGSAATLISSKPCITATLCQQLAYPLMMDSTQQSVSSPKPAGLQRDTSTSPQGTSVCSQHATKSTNQYKMTHTDSQSH